MNRRDFQLLAVTRVKEAKLLLDAGQSLGAYYLLGYAVECALKACIAKNTKRYDFPPERAIYNDIYTHDLVKLLRISGREDDFSTVCAGNPVLDRHWATVKDW